MVCLFYTPPISGGAGSLTNPDVSFAGLGYYPNSPNRPNPGRSKWGRYNCNAPLGRPGCSFVAPGNGEDGWGVQTAPYRGGTLPVAAFPFPVDLNKNIGGDSDFRWAARHNYQVPPFPTSEAQ
jgi:hypothetical protein